MNTLIYNKEPSALIDHMDTYFKEKPPECTMVSRDGHEIQFHKELLYQTKFMQKMVKTANLECCNCKVEIFCPSLVKEDLEIIVSFLYSGKISCSDQTVCSEVISNLTQLFGFPSIDFNGETNTWPTIKNEIEEPEDIKELLLPNNSLSVEVKPLKTDEDLDIPLDDLQPDDYFDTVKNYFVYLIFYHRGLGIHCNFPLGYYLG